MKKSAWEEKSIHIVLSNFLKLAQVFGYFPLENLGSNDPDKLNFKIKSLRMLYSMATLLGSGFMLCMQLRNVFRKGLTLSQTERVIWYSYGIAGNILFILIARKWETFIKVWCNVEKDLNAYGWTHGLEKRVRLVVGGLFLLAGIEYVVFQISKIEIAYNTVTGLTETAHIFLRNITYSHIFDLVPYSVPVALIIQIFNIQITFMWNFLDIFVIVISICLTYRMKQITKRVERTCYLKWSDEKTWKGLQSDYCDLHSLCRYINSELWYIILFSLSSNLYYLLVQFFNTLQPRQYFMENIYFDFSFLLLIFRIASFCLFTAMVYEESRAPLKFMLYAPSEIYNQEIRAFIEQISNTDFAITGYNLFYIKPDLILKIAGALVTYELVLLEGMKGKQ